MKEKKVLILLILIIMLCCVIAFSSSSNRNLSEEQTSVQEQSLKTEKNWEEDERAKTAKGSGESLIIISNEEAKPGSNIVVPVGLVNNPGVLGMSLTLSYDESKMKLKRVDNGEIFKGILSFSHSKELKSGCSFMWAGEDIKEDQIQDGTMLYLEFEINHTAATGKTPIIMLTDKEGVYDNDLSVINLSVDNGYLTIIN